MVQLNSKGLYQRIDADGREELLADPGRLLSDGVHVQLGDPPSQGLVLLRLVLVDWKAKQMAPNLNARP